MAADWLCRFALSSSPPPPFLLVVSVFVFLVLVSEAAYIDSKRRMLIRRFFDWLQVVPVNLLLTRHVPAKFSEILRWLVRHAQTAMQTQTYTSSCRRYARVWSCTDSDSNLPDRLEKSDEGARLTEGRAHSTQTEIQLDTYAPAKDTYGYICMPASISRYTGSATERQRYREQVVEVSECGIGLWRCTSPTADRRRSKEKADENVGLQKERKTTSLTALKEERNPTAHVSSSEWTQEKKTVSQCQWYR